MTIAFPDGIAVTIQTRVLGTVDERGNPTVTWIPTRVTGCAFAVAGSFASPGSTEAGDIVMTNDRLYFPAHVPLTSADRVTVNGLDYSVVGEPVRYHNPLSGFDYATANLQRITG